MTVKLDIHKILTYLPHRYPFLLVDRVEQLEEGKFISAFKNVTFNEPYFTGHFPDNPVMPGVLILEAMAQTGGILALESTKNPMLYFFAGIDNARFKQVVTPGDQLYFHIYVEKVRQHIWKFKAEALVSDKLVCSANLMIAGIK